MGNLYGKDASDPEWPSGGSTRATKVSYSVTDSELKVEGSTSKGEYELLQNKETIMAIVDQINAISEERKKMSVGAYQEGLLRYLTAIMRRVADFYKRKKPNLVERTLRDFEERELHGFDHDEAGRRQWKQWKEREAAEEEADTGSKGKETYRSRPSSRGSSPASQQDMNLSQAETDGSELGDDLGFVLDVIQHAGPGPHRSPKKKVMHDKLKDLQLERRTPSRSPSLLPVPFPKANSPQPAPTGLEKGNPAASSQEALPQVTPVSALGLALIPPEICLPSPMPTAEVPTKDVPPAKTLSVLKVGPDGRILGSQSSSGTPSAPSRAKGQIHHVLWDVLNENKARLKGESVLSDAALLYRTQKAIQMYSAIRDTPKAFAQTCVTIGKAGCKYYMGLKGLSASEKEMWQEMKTIHEQTFS